MSEKTLQDDESQIRRFLEFVQDREITEELVLDYLDYLNDYTFNKHGKQVKYSKHSIYQAETKLRLFLNTVDPTLCSDVQPRMPKKRKLPEDILNEEDVDKLLKACYTLRDKALIAFLFESGVRKGELFSIKKNNVIFDSMGAVVTIPAGKTGARRIRVVFSASYLRQYMEQHPNPDSNSFLFCSNRSPYGQLSNSGLKEQLKEIAKRAEITKNVFPHLLRHSAATRLAKHLSEQSLKTYLGWSQGSNMASVYVHMSGQDVDPDILKMNGIEVDNVPVPTLQVGRCPRCKELNPESSTYCNKCGLPLKKEAAVTESEVLKELIKTLTDSDKLEELLKIIKDK